MLDVSSTSKIEIGSLQALRASAGAPSQQASAPDTPDTPDTWQQVLLGIRCNKTRHLVFYDVLRNAKLAGILRICWNWIYGNLRFESKEHLDADTS